MIYYCEGAQSKVRRKKWMGQRSEKTTHKLPGVLSQSGHTGCAEIPLATNCYCVCVKCCIQGKLIQEKIFIQGWLQRYFLPSTYQNSRHPGGNQGFSINHIVYTSHLGKLSHFYQLVNSENILKMQAA